MQDPYSWASEGSFPGEGHQRIFPVAAQIIFRGRGKKWQNLILTNRN